MTAPIILIHADGANGSTTFTDDSLSANAVTSTNVTVSTTQSKFGGASAYCAGGGVGANTLNVAHTTALNFGTAPFTIEAWVYPTSFGGARSIFARRNASVFGPFDFQVGAGGAINVLIANTTNTTWGTIATFSGVALTENQWSHIAFVSTGSSLKVYVDGVGSSNQIAHTAIATTTDPLYIGAGGDSAFAGYIDEVRVSLAAVYTANFTPPTTAFVANPGVGNAAITAPSPTVAAYSGGIARLISPSPFLYAGVIGTGSAQLSAPSARAVAYSGAYASITAPSPTAYAIGHDSAGENDFAGTAPMASLVFSGGANARLTAPSPALAITGTFTGVGSADLAAPSATLSATGTVSAVANSALSAPMASVIGYSGAVCSITLTGKPALQATGTTGSVGVATLSCPLFELTASATRQTSGSANLIAPSPRMGATAQAWLIAPGAVLTAIGTAVVAVTYEAYSVNLTHKVRMQGEQLAIDEVTRYTNFPFTQIVRYQNSYFGVAADGLYLLEGTTDNGAPIAYAVKTCADDFKAPQKKTIVSAYFAGRIGPTMTVTLHAGETGQNAYSYSTPRGAGIQNHREKFGRGVKDRYFALGVSGTDVLEIDSVELEVNTLNRKI